MATGVRGEAVAQFEALSEARRTIRGLLVEQAPALATYFSTEPLGFRHRRDLEPKLSVASTASCVASLVASGSWEADRFAKADRAERPPTLPWAGKNDALVESLLRKERGSAGLFADNIFTTAFVAEAVAILLERESANDAREAMKEEWQKKISEMQDILISGKLPAGSEGWQSGLQAGYATLYSYPGSAYLTQLALRALLRTHELPGCGRFNVQNVNGVELREVDVVKNGVRDAARQHLTRQLALSAVTSSAFDVYQLAYSVIIFASITPPADQTSTDRELVSGGLRLFFSRQNEDGSWPRSQPLFHYPKVGAAFCYEYELLVQLLEEPSLKVELLTYLPQLIKAMRRLESTGQPLPPAHNFKAGGRGWTSGHHPQISSPESWSTASGYHFLHSLDRLIAEALRRAVFGYLQVPYRAPVEVPSSPFAPGFIDCTLWAGEEEKSLRDVVFQHFVVPLRQEAESVAKGIPMPKSVPTAAVLFGPPGTSKTELAAQISQSVGWPLLAVDPSHFVRGGLDDLQSAADLIFNMMANLEEVVIFVDEVEEMVRDRGRSAEVMSRFLTTAMLPKLARIHDARTALFLVATNHIEHFDLAIQRPGRFDAILQVLPPNLSSKRAKWAVLDRAIKVLVDEKHHDEVIDDLTDLTYLETVALVKRIEGETDYQQVLARINEARERGTLAAKTEYEGTEVSWRDLCAKQRKWVRVHV